LFFFCSLWLAGLAGLAGGFLFDQGYWSPVETRATRQPSLTEPIAPQPRGLVPRLDAALNVLFMATDVEIELRGGRRVAGLRGNTDTMILARLDPPRNQIRLLSIPRDTRVPIPGHGTFKINAANPYGGPRLAQEVVASFLEVPVDRYVVINTQGVIQLVDALGGVNVYVPKPMHYDDNTGGLHIHLDKGWNHLDGRRAHDFLRFRHDDQGDIGRVQRQQAFMQALMSQYLTPINLLKTPRLLAVARANMETDLTSDELVKVVGWAKDLERNQVSQAMVPGREAVIGGGWYWDPDVEGTRRVVEGFLIGASPEAARSPSSYRISLLDGVGDRKALERLRLKLQGAGYGTIEVEGRAAQLERDHTEIVAQNADEAGAEALATALGIGQVVVASTGVLGTDFTVIMGRDWLERH
jgi:LCP family protein required for cell wall assembly